MSAALWEAIQSFRLACTPAFGTCRLPNPIPYRSAVEMRLDANLVDDLLAMFGSESRPGMARLIDAGKLMLEDIELPKQP